MDTALQQVVRWQAHEGAGLEHLHVRFRVGAIRFDGVVIAGGPFAVNYTVHCDTDWIVRKVEAKIVGTEAAVVLGHDGGGRWTIDGRTEPALDGIFEPDLSITPLTNSMPIRRLGLKKGESADIRTAYVSFPDLAVFPDPQRYVCLEESRLYRYESRDSDFRRDVEIDGDGFVRDYPGLFRRTA